MIFNPFEYPICWSTPHRVGPTDWADNLPFGMFLVDLLRPRVLGELGTVHGISYCGFCQAVKELGLDTHCFAVNAWTGDPHDGPPGREILADLRRYHDPLYGDFSRLIPQTFDDALGNFADGTIDLLHIDGGHHFETVRHDFDQWLPKMSRHGVVLLHDIAVRNVACGVGKLWEELRVRYPSFELLHGQGLGVLATGAAPPVPLRRILDLPADLRANLQRFFAALGRPLQQQVEAARQIEMLDRTASDQADTIAVLTGQVAATTAQAASDRDHIQSLEADLAKLHAANENVGDVLRERDEAIAWLRGEVAEAKRQMARVQMVSESLSDQLHEILGSRGWRWLMRYRRLKERVSRRHGRRRLQLSTAGAVHGSDTVSQSSNPAPAGLEPAPATLDALPLLPALNQADAARLLAHDLSDESRHRPDVICFSIIDWEFRYQRPQQLMSQFAARGHRVFYISASKVRPGHADVGVRLIKDRVYDVQLGAAAIPEIYERTIAGDNAGTILDSLAQLRRTYDISSAVAYVMIASWREVAITARERWGWPVVYDCMDDWEHFPGMTPDLVRAEAALVQSCDLLVVSAARLADKWRSCNGSLVLARNAVDFELFTSRCRPNQLLAETTHPIVGYFGAIADWFDVDLLAAVARARPGYSFVLLGGAFGVDLDPLKALPNVSILGQQPYATMPQYLYHFDACIIPFKINKTTEATDPVKLYEYLSAGKPVVSVRLPEVEPYAEHVYLAGSAAEFVQQLDRAVAEEDRGLADARRQFAAGQTWADRYGRINAALGAAIEPASIIVVTYNNMVLTQLCLESILRNTAHGNYEVFVVDNASTDGTRAYLRHMAERHPEIRVMLNATNEGFARANNQALAESRGRHLVLLNNDTVVPLGWLGRLIQHLRDPTIGLVGPVTNFVGNEAKVEVPYSTWDEMERFAAERARRFEDHVADIDMLAMYCVAMRRDTYEHVGPLDERFKVGMFEDDDYSRRVRAAGRRVVCAADVFVHHVGQAAFRTLIRNREYDALFEYNRRAYEQKWNVQWRPHEHAPLAFSRSSPVVPVALQRGQR
jgi:GT2 family glycosyltransferase/glycosyltransferase involved in cell wall biosynthesis